MTVQRMDHVGINVDDLAAATEFFLALGLELQGEGTVEGDLVDRIVGLEGVRSQLAMLQTPDGQTKVELVKFHSPPAEGGDPEAPANTPGIRHLTFAVDDLDATSIASGPTAPSWSARWCATGTATCSATSVAPRGSSSSSRSRSTDGCLAGGFPPVRLRPGLQV
jgi:catechol 2,3-dioxygenase-like lactoylglutathione lyase family enzyme